MSWILHVDMDCFFVAVERLKNPSLIGKPVGVGGTGARGVVASCSYEARKFGVRSAMPVGQARRLCPALVMVKPEFKDYSHYSHLIFESLENLSPKVQQVSIDEAYLDLTGCERLYASRVESGKKIRQSVLEVSGLTCTVGIASNKLLAKIASDFAKPDGLLEIPVGDEEKFLSSLSVSKLPGIGPKTLSRLAQLGIHTCAQLAKSPQFPDFQKMAKGIDNRIVETRHERKSIGAERTFAENISQVEYLMRFLRDMSEDIATDLRKKNMSAQTVQIKIRYPDFTTVTRAKSISQPTCVAAEIAEIGQKLLIEHKNPNLPLRLLGISVRNLSVGQEIQLNLFNNEKTIKVEQLKDQLKQKFGDSILLSNLPPKPRFIR